MSMRMNRMQMAFLIFKRFVMSYSNDTSYKFASEYYLHEPINL